MCRTLLPVLHGDKEWLCHPSRGLQVAMLVCHYSDDSLTTLIHNSCMLDVRVQSAGSHCFFRVS